MADAAGGSDRGGGGIDFSDAFSDANPGSAAAQLGVVNAEGAAAGPGVALPLDASEPRLEPSPDLSAEPAMNAAAAAPADANIPSADVMAAIGAVEVVHGTRALSSGSRLPEPVVRCLSQAPPSMHRSSFVRLGVVPLVGVRQSTRSVVCWAECVFRNIVVDPGVMSMLSAVSAVSALF